MGLPKSGYGILGLPYHYYGISYEDTKLVPTRQKVIEESIDRAPTSGVLLVSGSAAAVVNQLLYKRKVVGISFSELFDHRFGDESSGSYPNSPVVLIYAIGLEAAKSKEYSSTILNSLLSYYKARETLVILETHLTPSNFQTTYGLTIKNTISIPPKEDEAWV